MAVTVTVSLKYLSVSCIFLVVEEGVVAMDTIFLAMLPALSCLKNGLLERMTKPMSTVLKSKASLSAGVYEPIDVIGFPFSS